MFELHEPVTQILNLGIPRLWIWVTGVVAAWLKLIPLCILALIPNALCISVDISLLVSYSDPAEKVTSKEAGR